MSRPDGTATARWLGRYEPNSPEWDAARAGYRIGGSEVAAIVGLSPWDSPYSLWMRKAGIIGKKPVNREMHWGTVLEDAVRTEWLRRHPDIHLVPGTHRGAGTWLHRADERFLANPDALIIRNRRREVLEIKTADSSQAWQWGPSGTDEIPVNYLCQVRWYLGVLGLHAAHVVCLIGGNDVREYLIEQDPGDWEWMTDAASDFLDSLAAGTPPDIDSSSATYEAIREAVPDVDRDAQAILPTKLADSYHRAVAALAQAKDSEQLHRSLVMDAMGTAHKAATDDGRHIATRSRRRLPSGEYSKTSLTPARNYTPTTSTQETS